MGKQFYIAKDLRILVFRQKKRIAHCIGFCPLQIKKAYDISNISIIYQQY